MHARCQEKSFSGFFIMTVRHFWARSIFPFLRVRRHLLAVTLGFYG